MTRRDKRNRLLGWLNELLFGGVANFSPRRIVVEPLERREVYANDTFLAMLGSADYPGRDNTGLGNTELIGEAETGLTAEGEPAPDLVAFAKALADAGVIFFGAAWCPHCNEQKQLFQDGYKHLPFVEVTNPDRTRNQRGIDEGITEYPTWQLNNAAKTRLTGVQTLQTLSQRTGIAIPTSSTPSLEDMANVSVALGSPLMVPVDAYDPNGNPLTITVTSSNPSVVSAQVLTGNRSLKIATDFGDMVFQMHEDKVPRAAGRVIQLADTDFYDGVVFHRVDQTFVIQGGDPLGTGSGGSNLGNFADQFHVDLQHNQRGVLSFAKATADDTGNSQFFITARPTRDLDYNHSVIGQLVEGEVVRAAIAGTAVNGTSPRIPVVMNSVTTFTDTENGLIQLRALGTSGTSTITVTVTDSEGLSTSKVFTATAIADTANSGPFLNDISTVRTTVGTPVTVNLTSQDVEGDARVYSVAKVNPADNFTVTVDSATGVATVTPGAGFTGQLQFRASVSQTPAVTNNTASKTDEQLVTVLVGPVTPTAVDLVASSDSGSSSTDNITNASTLSFTVTGTVSGATVRLKAGGNVIGQASATSSTTTVNVTNPASLGEGPIVVVATQTVGSEESGESPGVTISRDTTAPAPIAAGVIPANAQVGQALSVNLAHSEEGQGLVYSATGAPSGLTVAASTGQISWTPTVEQLGARTFTLSLTDAAGNVSTQQVTITVIEQPLIAMTLQVVDLSGNPITTIAAGQNFIVKVLVQDLRSGDLADGVFSAFTDILFDSNVIEPIATDPINHGTQYNSVPSGDVATPGVVNELGGVTKDLFTNLDGDPRVLAEVTFRAKVAGNPALRLDPADSTLNENLLYEDTTPVTNSKISYGTSNFAVGANFALVNDTFNFDEDSGVKVLTVLSNDTVSGGDVLTITAVGPRSGGGTVTIGTGGTSLNYTSASNFNGAETFTYTARNQSGVEQTATVTIQVTDVNDPPVAVNDTFNVFTNSSNNTLEVLSNDTRGVDANATESLSVTAVGTGSAGGTIALGPSGLTLRYTPLTGFTGTETFTYTLSDGRGLTSTGTVSVTVAQQNPPPTAVTDNFTIVEDAAQASFNVLQNDSTSDPGETLSVSGVTGSNNGATVSVATDGQAILYRPAPNFSGVDVIGYTLRDSRGGTSSGTVTFTVTAVNDAPNAVDDNVTVQTGTPTTTLTVLSNDINPDVGENVTITAVTQPASGRGTVAIAADGRSLIYTSPSTPFEGTFAFTYTIGDGSTLTDTATVNVTAQAFTPRTIGGELVIGGITNANSDMVGIGGVDLVLSGTDYTGQAVTRSRTVAPDGTFAYDSLPPGNYTLQRQSLPFLHDTGAQVQISSATTSGDQLNNILQVGGLRPEFFDIRDFLGSVPTSSLTVAIDSTGKQQWFAPQGEWAGLRSLNVTTNSTGDSLVVNATNSSQQNLTGNVAINNAARVAQLGQESSMRLLRIVGSPTQAGLTASTGRQPGAASPTAATAFTTTASGLKHKILRAGTSERATDASSITVDYRGTLVSNGTVFDETYDGTTPATFTLSGLIAGWREGLKLIGEGGMIELEVPPALGYGATGSGASIPPNATLNFIIELISINSNSASGEGEGEGTTVNNPLAPDLVDQAFS